jgi:chromosome segregation protein
MLKRLELVGFKSFADKTQFDFPAGITAIVGPNGSGKSNVVDAVRWILGEQSAKSLRGGEMADVIFNGSTSRRSLGLAEVTMTFDNRRRSLGTQADEVQITRRVYRSGEGEYLINQQACRLKDIKDLFLGSGAGTDAYCVIEQGRVDVLLQASTRDRRVIFEEAAGISRFKAKKLETLRKLERVDQNLQRLRDIIDEVEKQLRSVKLQASKAQRYQEYSNRLKELRVALGLEEYHQLTQRLDAEAVVLEGLRTGLQERSDQADAWEADTRRLEESLGQLEEKVRHHEATLANSRQQIAAEETTLGHEWSLTEDLETDLASTRARLTELSARVTSLVRAAAGALEELEGAEVQGQKQRSIVKALDEQLAEATARLAELQTQIQADQVEHLEQVRQASRLHNDAVTSHAQINTLRRERERLLLKTEQAAGHLASLDLELQELRQADEALQARLAGARQTMADQRQEHDRLRQERDTTAQALSDLRARRSGLASRIEVLEGLERSHEGLGTGVREVVDLLEKSPKSTVESKVQSPKSKVENATDDGAAEPAAEVASDVGSGAETLDIGLWTSDLILGLVADFLAVPHEYAPLIDLALGERAQHFVVRDAAKLDQALRQRQVPFSGRVSFLQLGSSVKEEAGAVRPSGVIEFPASDQTAPTAPTQSAPKHPGIVASADSLVTCDHPDLADLPSQLLGKTFIVRDMVAARAVAARASGYRFVTLAGELLEADGTLTVGVHHAEAGILSRKSELRELRLATVEMDLKIGDTERQLAQLRDQVATLEMRAGTLQQEIEGIAEQAADLRSRIGQRRQRREGLHEEMSLGRHEMGSVDRDLSSLQEAWQQARTQADAADRQVQVLQARLEEADREIRARDQRRQQCQQELTAAKVALATVEERLTALRAKHGQIQTDLDQRRQERAQGEQHFEAAQLRLKESQSTMLRATSALANWYLQKEAAEREIAGLTRERDLERHERQILAERAQHARNEWRAQQEQAHARELEANDLRHRRETLSDRLREDYQIELAQLYAVKTKGQIESQVPTPKSKVDGADEPEGIAAADIGRGAETLDFGLWTLDSPIDQIVATEEITELRRKLTRLGSVSLDSLQELAELETRADTLETQYADLSSAKRSLEEIIATINQDSRRLFTETFASIRTHFQELFRKLFGGGQADILLEDENDILESGIEIIARPPGKELRSISLMSGGEKTLTAVALLLAIFRSKPSPFCILDEVDAALDEANIGRFTTVLRDFLDQSQFIIITHSKKTMAVADVLYGVTMQESGISKRVAVRFEDWVEDGQPAETTPVAAAQRNGE